MKLSMELGSFEVILYSLLMSSGDVRGASEMYSWSSLMDKISYLSRSTTPNSIIPFWAARYVRSGSSGMYFLFLVVLRKVVGSGTR